MRELVRRVRCPVLVIHGADDAITRRTSRGVALAEPTGGELVLLEGSGHGPHVRDPVKVNLLLRDFVAPPRPARRAGCAASRAASARSTSPRRSASATPSATPRSPTSCASCIPTSRSTGSRSIRSRPCSRRAASASIRRARSSRTSRSHIESESAEHDLHCFQAIRRMDEILLAQLHGLPRPRPRRALRPLDRRRGVGARLLPAREPGAEAGGLRLADRLRRLAADGRTAASARRS